MKTGIIISCTDAETVWNAFRLGSFAIERGDGVKVFLLGRGVECANTNSEAFDVPDFDVHGQMENFAGAGGEILACGTCLQIRQSKGSEICPISTMADLYNIVDQSDRLLTF